MSYTSSDDLKKGFTALYYDNGRAIKCVMIGRFYMKLNHYMSKKVLFRRKVVSTDLKKYIMIFIPWKHKAKELILAPADRVWILGREDERFILVDQFCSCFSLEHPYATEYDVQAFKGFDFVYENNDFIANVYNELTTKPLDILYKAMPELLNLEFDEESY